MEASTVREFIGNNVPDVNAERLKEIQVGWDNIVLESTEGMMFRIPRRRSGISQIATEVRILQVLRHETSVPVPAVIRMLYMDDDFPIMCYEKIQGRPITNPDTAGTYAETMSNALAHALTEIHDIPIERVTDAGLASTTSEDWYDRYEKLLEQATLEVAPLLPLEVWRRLEDRWRGFLAGRLDANRQASFTTALAHCDLVDEHILVDPPRRVLAGIIDWGDAEIGDPAIDFAGLLRLGGPAFVRRVLDEYGGPADRDLRSRADFYLHLAPVHGILFGLANDSPQHVTDAITRLTTMTDA